MACRGTAKKFNPGEEKRNTTELLRAECQPTEFLGRYSIIPLKEKQIGL
jgi:hypothetical protein